MLDENTNTGGSKYELTKNYFNAVADADGYPYGIPYVEEMVGDIVSSFDGLFSVGGSVAFPVDWYATGHATPYSTSSRTTVEIALMKAFLDHDKLVLGACNGMQMLGAIHDCKLRSDVESGHRNTTHSVQIAPGTILGQIVGVTSLDVNSRHREAIAEVSHIVKVSASGADGIVEALEIPHRRFALGYQWHQEDFWNVKHPGNPIFSAFITACRAGKG